MRLRLTWALLLLLEQVAHVAAASPPQRPLPRYEHAEQSTGSRNRRPLNVNDSVIRERFSAAARERQRRLQDIIVEEAINYDYAPTTSLRFTSRDNEVLEGFYQAGNLDGVYAGVPLVKVEVVLSAAGAIWGVNTACLKIVDDAITVRGAGVGECESLAMSSDVVNSPWYDPMGAPTLKTIGENTKVLTVDPDAAPTLDFRKGGLFKVCYSHLGSFESGPADPILINIAVAGIYTSCEGDNCLAEKVNYCYQLKRRSSTFGSCVFDYSDVADADGNVFLDGTGYYGALGKASWSAAYVVPPGELLSTGEILSVEKQQCGVAEPHRSICPPAEGCSGSARFFNPTTGTDGTEKSFQLEVPVTDPTLERETYVGFSVSMCYCPSYDYGSIQYACNEAQDFVQQVGVIHVFAVKGCHADDVNCLTDVSGIMPQYGFKLWVLCPPTVCPIQDVMRVKLAESSALNDKPWWDGNGCAEAEETKLLVEPGNCFSPDNCTVTGGTRMDYKAFGSSNEAFMFKNGHTNYEVRNFHESVEFDVCFCLDNCEESDATWLKAGIFRFAPLRLVSAATYTADKPMLEYVNYPGVIALNRNPEDDDVLGLQDGGVVKILMDLRREKGDDECGKENYDNALVDGLTATTAGSDYRAKAAPEFNKLVFNNGNPARTLTVRDPGIIAVCYCAKTTDAICASPEYWKLLSHLVIKGPKPSQSWVFSTNVVFKFSYEGYGLSSTDTIRIIETDAKCTDAEGNPNQADTSISYGHPDNPQQVSNVPGEEWNFPTFLLTSETVRCNRIGICDEVYIKDAVVLNATHTELTFTENPDLFNDDVITISDLRCDSDCTVEQVSEAMATFEFADKATNAETLPDSYIFGHAVTRVPGSMVKYTIPLGWPGVKPKFKTIAPGAKWVRRNTASTYEEILGVKEKSNLKVCWSFGGNGKYVMEMGRINLRDPTPMIAPRISLSTRAQTATNDVRAPVIISFQTTTSASGLTYSSSQGSMQLKFVFTNVKYFEGLFNDGTEITNVAHEDEIVEATQEICGRLFLEAWSDNMAHGFPTPKGCYYRVIGDESTDQRIPQIGIVFEEKNGLRAGYNYQLVMRAVAKHQLRADDPQGEGTYLEIYSMDDVVANPYGAVELGHASMSSGIGREPEPTDPQFGERGLTIIGGYNNVVELDSDVPLQFELRGGDGVNTGLITASAYLKIFLNPLTQWTTGVSCDARCLQGGENPFYCGTIESCIGAALVNGFQNNYIQMRLPPDMEDLYAERKQTIHVGGLTLPSGAIYPRRYAAELTTKDGPDRFPHYTTSVGDLVYKPSGTGRMLARLVDTVGDGNEKPFKKDKGNVLYVQLMFAGIMKAEMAGESGFTITLPKGYIVNEVGPAPSSLYVFNGNIPQGRGTLDQKGWSWNGNVINYEFMNNFVIFSGSSLYLEIVVDNPESALKDTDDSNVWYLDTYGRGVGDKMFYPPTDPFIGAMEGYASNAAVLGKLHQQVIQQTGFAASTSKIRNYQMLRVFFRSEQNITAGGYIGIFAPPIWEFGEEPGVSECHSADLEDQVYATGPFETVHRLPDMASATHGCRAEAVPAHPDVQHRAFVNVAGRIKESTLYAFQIQVLNPTTQQILELAETSALHAEIPPQYTWRIVSLDHSRMAVDGSYDPVPTNPDGTGEISTYMHDFEPNKLQMRIANMLPACLMAGQPCAPTLLTITFEFPENVEGSGMMLLTAPDGFIFGDIKDLGTPPGADPLPAINVIETSRRLAGHQGNHHGTYGHVIVDDKDRARDNKLILAARSYMGGTPLVVAPNYGFTMPMSVPDMSPTMSSNGFFMEIGFNEPQPDHRIIAGFMLSEKVRTLVNPQVRYNYNVVGKENTMMFEIQLISAVPANGALTIGVPKGFRFAFVCRPTKMNSYADYFLPVGHECSYIPRDDGEGGTIWIYPGPEGLAAQTYVFTIVGTNPQETSILQVDQLMPCGFSMCWRFATLGSATDLASYRDMPTYATGFAINRKMIQARLPLISEAVRAGTGRNDKPNEPNQLIFSFSLNDDLLQDSTLVLRGPYGFRFAEDCHDQIVTAEDKVFGEGNKWPPEYDPWEAEAEILSCRGELTDAHIKISKGLLGEKKYAFRIGVASNPDLTPQDYNQWVVDFGGETSEPFDGFTLWTFTEVALDPISRARSQRGVDVLSVGNAVKLAFKPYNTVFAGETGASYRLTLPPTFTIVHVNYDCPLIFEALPYDNEDGLQQPGVMFTQFDINCKVDQDLHYIATMRLSPDMIIHNDRAYRMTIEVNNPQLTTAEMIEQMFPEEFWMLESFAASAPDSALARDAIRMPSYEISPVLIEWGYRNLDPITGVPQVNGKTEVRGLQLIMRFPDALINGDMIFISAPPGFILEDEYGQCRNGGGKQGTAEEGARLPNSPCQCDGGTMTIMVLEGNDPAVGPNQEARYLVDTTNPPKNLDDMENYWRIEHFSVDGTERSSHVFRGWIIIPQLESVMARVVGPFTAAGSREASIEFTFRSVTDADAFYIEAVEPIDIDTGNSFDFTNARCSDPNMIMRNAGTGFAELFVYTYAAQVYTVRIDGVRFPLAESGATRFHLATYTGGAAAGQKQDEKRDFTDGFRLPGMIRVTKKRLESEQALQPEAYPIQSLWSPRLGVQARVEFRFYTSLDVPALSTFHINTGIYNILRKDFELYNQPRASVVPTTLWRLVGNDVRYIIEKGIDSLVPHRVRFYTVAPTDVSRGNGVFLLEFTDDEALPICTQDGLTEGFQLAVEMDFRVTVERSPPSTYIPLKLNVDPKGSRPTELNVYAPSKFNFTADCLISGPPEVISCQPDKALFGREKAVLTLTDDGLVDPPDNLRIRVLTPESTPKNADWLLDGIFAVNDAQVGWGEDSDGIQIYQMRDTSVMYAGATGILSEFAVWFYNVEELEAGGILMVHHPTAFGFDCTRFNPISLPGGENGVACKVFEGEGKFGLAFNHTMAPGEYSFTIVADLPVDAAGNSQEFSVILIDRHGNVQDAKMNFGGPTISDILSVSIPGDYTGFMWYPEKIQANQVTEVMFVLNFDNPVPPDPSDPPLIGELLFTLPRGFVHDIQTITDVKNEAQSGSQLHEPPTGPIIDYTQMDRVRVAVNNGQYDEPEVDNKNPNNTKPATNQIQKGTYAFRFPVIVPEIVDPWNIWVVSICNTNGGCSSPGDTDVLLNFPLAGFSVGDVHPLTSKKAVSFATPYWLLSALLCIAMQ